ncbi:uncharacterized protein [Littorina saxatilis]|uniref:Uncharacterized protein n=1 Tax=Littorina saxatilis TaxID=31220 RepID=A0AAN9BH54_9CAEN
MINNEMYEDSEDQLNIVPSAGVQVDRVQHHPDDSSGHVPLALHCHAPPPPLSMVLAEGAGCMDLSSSGDETDGACADTDADGMPFVDEQEHRSEEGGAGIHVGGNGNLYVPAKEVRRKKQEQQKRYVKETEFQGEENGDDNEQKCDDKQTEPEENSAEDGQRSSAEVRRQKRLQHRRIANEREEECATLKDETVSKDCLYVPATEVRRKRRQQQTLKHDVNPKDWYAPVADLEGKDTEQTLRTEEWDNSSSF